GIRERLEGADVPVHFRGTAIAMITAGIMSLAFMGFAGLDKFK
ncbi:MAG: Rnf-Nqr domain containing protein, partial [Rhodocyclaceae bacterium]|nr:Rnf-Nqr domain containing protein [Rhodocyclaceae bacterium]